MNETPILQALQTGGIAAYNASNIHLLTGWTDKTRIKAIGRTLSPLPNDGRYVEFVNIPNNISGMFYGDERVYQGIFRIILHWDETDQGVYEPMQYLDEMAGYFEHGRILPAGALQVKFYGNPNASGMITSGSELLFPVGLSYRCSDLSA